MSIVTPMMRLKSPKQPSRKRHASNHKVVPHFSV